MSPASTAGTAALPGKAGSNHRAPDPAARTCLSIAATRQRGKQSGLLPGFLPMSSSVPVSADASGAADVVAEVRHERGFAAGAVAVVYQHSRTTVADRVTEDIGHID